MKLTKSNPKKPYCRTYNAKEFNDLLEKAGVGGWFDSSRRLFDQRFAVIGFEELNDRVTLALDMLKLDDLDPTAAYREDDADCDNYAWWIWSDVTKQWAREQHNAGALGFGSALLPGHELNIGVTDQGIQVWNYGVYTPNFDLSQITEVNFK